MLEQQLPDQVEFQKQWYESNEQSGMQRHRFSGMGQEMTPEDMVMHSAIQLQDPREYGIDPALGTSVDHSLAYHHDSQNGSRSLPAEGYVTSFVDDDSAMVEARSDEQDEVESVAGANGIAKKASKSSAANELEMRQLFQTNKHRSLPEVASELHGNERGPQSERTRQVFAMLW